jgi:hypothetical protein
VDLGRIGWLLTVALCAVVAVACLVSGYQGYGAVTGAVLLAAAINLLD